MEIVFCLIPEDRSFKPAVSDVAELLRFLLENDYIDNEDVYLDIAYDSGHHRTGTSDTITAEDAAAELQAGDDIEINDFSIENIRGTSRVPELFENCNQKNQSLTGWLAIRVFEEPYPILDTEEDYSVRCGFCGHEANHKQWAAEGTLWRCPACDSIEDMQALDFSPAVEFARFILEISELVFTDFPPQPGPCTPLTQQVGKILGCELKPVWYRI